MSDITVPLSTDTNASVTGVIEQSRELTFQDRAKDTPTFFAVIPGLAYAGLYMPAWWSPYRDQKLRGFWKKIDYLSGAIYTMIAKMTAIPRKVVAVNPSIREHTVEAELMTEVINQASDYGEGWVSFYSKWLQDLLTQDNGAFAEIIGDGEPDGPIIGRPITVANLDSSRCQRTGNPEFPVLYQDTDSNIYKLHYTRVMFSSQMPSTDVNMFGVGFCAVSRVINVAQTLLDILVYKQEKLGSRPHQEILVTRGGLDPNDVALAFQMAEQTMDNMGLSRYSKIVLAGSSTIMDADIKQVELSTLPDGFDEYNSITLGMATIALGLGVDARELFPAMGAGATRADALLQHLKQRGKGPGQIIETTEQVFNFKFLPSHLRFLFDFQDDAQDRQSAEIRKIRHEGWNYALTSGTMNVRAVREQMVALGDLDRSQFERMELEDGRLPDGTELTVLFYSNDRKLTKYLKIDTEDPLDTDKNDKEEIEAMVKENQKRAKEDIANSKDESVRWYARVSLAALDALLELYDEAEEEERMEEVRDQIGADGQPAGEDTPPKVADSEQRTRRQDLVSPTDDQATEDESDLTGTHPDDETE